MAHGTILTVDDFVGEWDIPIGTYIDTKLNEYIDQVQEDYLTDLLGHTLYDDFHTGLEVVPPAAIEQKWLDLRDGQTYGTSPNVYKFKGVKTMLKYFTYYEYMRYAEVKNTKNGQRTPDGTNSVAAGSIGKSQIRRMYNKGIAIYHDAILFINDKNSPSEIYPDLLHTKKNPISII